MSKKTYAFPSLKDVKKESAAEAASAKTKPTKQAPTRAPKRSEVPSSDDEIEDESSSSASEIEPKENRANQREVQYEPEAEDDMEAELEQEDGGSQKRKRLPELDFVLSFAHKRARELLRTSDEDDTALVTVVSTWLAELEDRFETFEKQVAKYDEYESALLQSQRMHHKIRKQITLLLKQESDIKRALDQATIQNERRKLGQTEAQKAQELLAAIRKISKSTFS